jgi:[protein-PII] uridylyltransferase
MKRHKDVDAAFAALTSPRESNPHDTALEAYSLPDEIAPYLLEQREVLMEHILNPPQNPANGHTLPVSGQETTAAFSDLMDAVIRRMYHLACQRLNLSAENLSLAIVATGGYGRRELCPYSDIDITFIPLRDKDPAIDRVIKDMFRQLMEVCITRCKVEVGYAYRLMNDCGNLDHQTTCGLLDARLIAGSPRIFIQFEEAFWTYFNAAEFIFTKIAEREKVISKWGVSPRIVEPQLKEGAGGLRDIHNTIWLVQAREHLAAARVRGARAMHVLEIAGEVDPSDVEAFAKAKEFILQVRQTLHALTRAERDQLVVTRQEDIATRLNYTEATVPPNTPPVEVFMADLYNHLATIQRITRQVTRRVEQSRLIMGIGIDCRRKQLVASKDAFMGDDPAWCLWACEVAQRYELEIGESLERLFLDYLRTAPSLVDPLPAAQIFTQMIGRLGKVYPLLQSMADWGMLGWLFPEFGALMNLIPYDPSHDHTVGQHTLYIARNLEDLLTMSGDEETNTMRRLLQELPHPEQLMMAVLLHDAGKAHPGRPHSEEGEEIAERVCKRMGWSEEATANVCFLVRQHLVMAEVSRLRDLEDEKTIRDFVQIADDIDRLNMLYLLTYADTKAVGSGVWTQVKGRFLHNLWQRAAGLLTDEDDTEIDERMTRARRRVVKDLSNFPVEEVEEHVQAMPPGYLLGQSLDRIALQIGLVRRVREGETVIEFMEERNATYTEMTVCTYDDPNPGLLAKITGVLYAAGLEVHSAHVLTRVTDRDRIAMDTLWVDFRARPLTASKQKEVAQHLKEVLAGRSDVATVLQKYAAKALVKRDKVNLPTDQKVRLHSVRNDLSEQYTVIETDSPDIRSALYRVADALSQMKWDIHSAKVSFWQGAARASFYVAGARNMSEVEVSRALSGVLPLE